MKKAEWRMQNAAGAAPPSAFIISDTNSAFFILNSSLGHAEI
jgi:hypothetical protein